MGAVIFGVNLYLVYFLQIVFGYSPLQTGLVVLPLRLEIMASAMISTAVLLTKVGAKILVPSGMIISAIDAMLLRQAEADSSYALHAAVPMFVIAIGLAVMNTPVASATFAVFGAGQGERNALVSGYGSAYVACIIALIVGAVVKALVYRRRHDMTAPSDTPAVHM